MEAVVENIDVTFFVLFLMVVWLFLLGTGRDAVDVVEHETGSFSLVLFTCLLGVKTGLFAVSFFSLSFGGNKRARA